MGWEVSREEKKGVEGGMIHRKWEKNLKTFRKLEFRF